MDQPSDAASNGQRGERGESTPQAANSSPHRHSSRRPLPDAPHSSSFASTSRSRPPSQTRLTQPAGPGLNEFGSLLEAAQRIADSAGVGTSSERWPDDERPDPVIRRSSGADDFRRRVPLTRQYSGRPHIPGEDSGSEDEEDRGPIRAQAVTMDGHRGGRSEQGTRATSEERGEALHDREAQEARQQLQRAAARLRARRDLSEDRQRRREEMMLRMRERERADEFAADVASGRTPRPEHYATTGPPPVRESFYDWAPEPQDAAGPSTTTDTRMQGRSSSVRRWRPAERLQDYASNHARRSSGHETSDHSRILGAVDYDSMAGWARTPPAPRQPGEFGDHNDIVDRVERALQEYRAARRILQPRQDASAPEPHGTVQTAADSRGVAQRPPRTNAAAQDVSDNLSMLQDVVSRNAQATTGSNDTSEAPANRPWRNESLRQRILDHRRRFFSTLLGPEGEDLASGPLFDASDDTRHNHESLDTERWRADTRKMLDKVRRAEIRAKSKQLKQAKAALKYLACLRQDDMDDVRAWTLASELRLHNQSLEESLKKNLPISVDSLPKPAFCSWLEPGMTWTGAQSAEQEMDDAKDVRSRTTSDAVRRAREQQDRVDIATRQNESFRARMRHGRDPVERAITSNHTQDPLSMARSSMQVLEDAERNLSSMLERSERLLRENERQLQENEEQLARNRERLRRHDQRLATLRTITTNDLDAQPLQHERVKTKDRWNVKVTLHEVDWQKMTLTGTMTASHTPNIQPDGPERLGDEASMDSFFTGEIVDFARYGLDTITPTDRDRRTTLTLLTGQKLLQDDYKVGGPETDLTYWAGIGPFKEEVDEALEHKLREREQSARRAEFDKLSSNNPGMLDVPTVAPTTLSPRNANDPDKIESLPPATNESIVDTLPVFLNEDEKYDIAMSTMHDLLTNTRWLKENINARGWVLMRWKERCFVAPGTEPNPEPNRPWVPSRNRSDDTASVSDRRRLSYADLYRRRQDVRNGQRIYTTNAAEREEIGGTSGTSENTTRSPGSRQPTWGLTISGFYYVALHRVSGRIEALYYDCGSAPFQTLKMSPATRQTRLGMMQEDAMDVDEQVPAKDGLPIMPGGLRTNFNVVAWR